MSDCAAWVPDTWCTSGPMTAHRSTRAHWEAPRWYCPRHLAIAQHADSPRTVDVERITA